MRKTVSLVLASVLGLSLSGCAAIAIVDTAVGVTTTVVGTAVDVTGAVISGAAGAVSGSKDEEPDCDKDENKDKEACKKKAQKDQ
jgi:phage tail tape-measure protein